jgi:chromosome partitioning protein
MKTLAVVAGKGGAGKTTLSVHLAVAAEQAGKTCAVIDLDPQASASAWKDLRLVEAPVVVSAQAVRLPQVLEAAANNGATLAIIDTAPHSDRDAMAAARAADLVLIPCRPAILDLKAISLTIDLTKLTRADACLVLNAVPPRGPLAEDAEAAMEVYDVPVAPVRIGQRAAFVHALTSGQTAQEYEPDGKAAQEISDLYKWVCKKVKL